MTQGRLEIGQYDQITAKSPICWMTKHKYLNNFYAYPNIRKVDCRFSSNAFKIDYNFESNVIYEVVITFTRFRSDQLNFVGLTNLFPDPGFCNSLRNANLEFLIFDGVYLIHLQNLFFNKPIGTLNTTNLVITSTVPNEPKTVIITFKVPEDIPAYPNNQIEIHFPAISNGVNSPWRFDADLFSPPVIQGGNVKCSVELNVVAGLGSPLTIPGRGPVSCIYQYGIENWQPAVIEIIQMNALQANDRVTIMIENLVGPSASYGFGGYEIHVRKRPGRSNYSILPLKPTHVFATTTPGVVRTFTADLIITNSSKKQLNETSVNSIARINSFDIDYSTNCYIEIIYPSFLTRQTLNSDSIEVLMNGEYLLRVGRNPQTGKEIKIAARSAALNSNIDIELKNVNHPTSAYDAEFTVIMKFYVDKRLSRVIQLNYPIIGSFVPDSITISSLWPNKHPEGMAHLNFSIDTPLFHDDYQLIKISIPSTDLLFTNCLQSFGTKSFLYTPSSCKVSRTADQSVIYIFGYYGNAVGAIVSGVYSDKANLDFLIQIFDASGGIKDTVNKQISIGFTSPAAATLPFYPGTPYWVPSVYHIAYEKYPKTTNIGLLSIAIAKSFHIESDGSITLTPLYNGFDVFRIGTQAIACQFITVNEEGVRVNVVDSTGCDMNVNSKVITIGGPYLQDPWTLDFGFKLEIKGVNGTTIPDSPQSFKIYGEKNAGTRIRKGMLHLNPPGNAFLSVKSFLLTRQPGAFNFFQFELNTTSAVFPSWGTEKNKYFKIEFDTDHFSEDLGAIELGFQRGESFLSQKNRDSQCSNSRRNVIIFGDQGSGTKSVMYHYLMNDSSTVDSKLTITLPFIKNPILSGKPFIIKISLIIENTDSLLSFVVNSHTSAFDLITINSGVSNINPTLSLDSIRILSQNVSGVLAFDNPASVNPNLFERFILRVNNSAISKNNLCQIGVANMKVDYFSGDGGQLSVFGFNPMELTSTGRISIEISNITLAAPLGNLIALVSTYSGGFKTGESWTNPVQTQPISGDIRVVDFRRLIGSADIRSEGLYEMTFQIIFPIQSNYTLIINLPNEFSTVDENIIDSCFIVQGLVQASENYMACNRNGSKAFKITGFSDIAPGTLVKIRMFLENPSVSFIGTPNMQMFTDTSSLYIDLQNFPNTSIHNYSGNPGNFTISLATRNAVITANSYSNLWFVIAPNRTINMTWNDTFAIEFFLPPGFVKTPNAEITAFYKLKSTDEWTAVNETTVNNNSLIFLFNRGEQLFAGRVYDFLISSDNGTKQGFLVAGYNSFDFVIFTFLNGITVETGYYNFILEPIEVPGNQLQIESCVNTGNERNILVLRVDPLVQLQPKDEVWIELPVATATGMTLFNEDAGLDISSLASYISCSHYFGEDAVVTFGRETCVLIRGDLETRAPVLLKILIERTVNIGQIFRIVFPDILNPSLSFATTLAAKVKVTRPVQRNGKIFSILMYKSVNLNFTSNAPITREYLTTFEYKIEVDNATVAASNVTFLFKLRHLDGFIVGDIIAIKFPANKISLQDICSSAIGSCFTYASRSLVILRLNQAISGGNSVVIFPIVVNNPLLTLDPNSLSDRFNADCISKTNKVIFRKLQYDSPVFQPLVYTQLSAIETQSKGDRFVNGFISKDYINVLKIRIPKFFNSALIQRIVITGSESFSRFDGSICNATLTLQTANFLGKINGPSFSCSYTSTTLELRIEANSIATKKFNLLPKSQTSEVDVNVFIRFALLTNGVQDSVTFTLKSFGIESRLRGIANITLPTRSFKNYTNNDVLVSRSIYPGEQDFEFYLPIIVQPQAPPNLIVTSLSEDFKQAFTRVTPFACRFSGRPEFNISKCEANPSIGQGNVIIAQTSQFLLESTPLLIQNPGNFYRAQNNTVQAYVGYMTVVRVASGQDPTPFYSDVSNLRTSSELSIQRMTFEKIRPSPLENIRINTALDANFPTFFNITFDVGVNGVIGGYDRKRPGRTKFSNIVLRFRITDGYDFDLDSWIRNDHDIGCAALSNLRVIEGTKLKCTLTYGTDTRDPQIVISQYDDILAGTKDVSFIIANIRNPPIDKEGSIRIGVVVTDDSFSGVSHAFRTIIPEQVSQLTALSPQSGIASLSGSDSTYGLTNYTFTFQPTSDIQSFDMIGFLFNPELFNEFESAFSISMSPAGNVIVLPESRIIYVRPNQMIPSTTFSLKLRNVPNAPYAINGVYSIKIWTIVNRKVQDQFLYQIHRITLPNSQITKFNVSFGSLEGGVTDTSSTFAIVLGHHIDPTGIFTLEFPIEFGIMSGKCGVTNFPTILCSSTAPRVFRFNLNGTSIDAADEMAVFVNGINIPNQANLSSPISLKVQFSASSGFVTSQTSVSVPPIHVNTLLACDLKIFLEYYNTGVPSKYQFNIDCPQPLKNDSTITLVLPREFTVTFGLNLLVCSASPIETFLNSKNCTINYQANNATLNAKIKYSASKLNLTFEDIMNPVPGNYLVRGILKHNNGEYGGTNNFELRIVNDSQLVDTSSVSTKLIHFPKSPNVLGTYVFFTSINAALVINTMIFRIPLNTFTSTTPISCSYIPLADINENSQTLSQVQDIIKASQPVTCLAKGNNIEFSGITPATSKYNYNAWIIQGIPNPSASIDLRFTLYVVNNYGRVQWWKYQTKSLDVSRLPIGIRFDQVNSTEVKVNFNANLSILLKPMKDYVGQVDLQLGLSSVYQSNINETQKCSYSGVSSECKGTNNTFKSINNAISIGSSSPITLSIQNLKNPSFPSACPAEDGKFNSFYNFIATTSTMEGIAMRSFNILHSKANCLAYTQVSMKINFTYGSALYPTLHNKVIVTLEKPSSKLKLVFESPIAGVVITPSTLDFSKNPSATGTIDVAVSYTVPPGTIRINIIKIDPDAVFQDVTELILPIEQLSSTPIQEIQMKTLLNNIYDNNSPFFILFSFDKILVDPIYIEVDIDDSPTGITIQNNRLELNSTVSEVIQTIQANSEAPKKFTVKFTAKGRNSTYVPYKIVPPTLDLEITKAVNFDQNLKIVGFNISNVSKNNASFKVEVTRPAVIFYLLTYSGSQRPPAQSFYEAYPPAIQTGFVASGFTGEKHIGKINLTKLEGGVTFTLYVIGNNSVGQSDIWALDFRTNSLSPPMKIQIPLNGKQTPENLIHALSMLLGIPMERILFDNTIDLSPPPSIGSDGKTGLIIEKYLTTLLINPDPFNDDNNSPLSILPITETIEFKRQMKDYLSNFDDFGTIIYTPYIFSIPAMVDAPEISAYSYYNTTFLVKLTGPGQVYGLRIKRDNPDVPQFTTPPSPFQIIKGIDTVNWPSPNNYFYTNFATNSKGYALVTFEDVRPEFTYDFYFVQGTIIKLHPPKVSSKEDVKHYVWSNPTNPNARGRA